MLRHLWSSLPCVVCKVCAAEKVLSVNIPSRFSSLRVDLHQESCMDPISSSLLHDQWLLLYVILLRWLQETISVHTLSHRCHHDLIVLSSNGVVFQINHGSRNYFLFLAKQVSISASCIDVAEMASFVSFRVLHELLGVRWVCLHVLADLV